MVEEIYYRYESAARDIWAMRGENGERKKRKGPEAKRPRGEGPRAPKKTCSQSG